MNLLKVKVSIKTQCLFSANNLLLLAFSIEWNTSINKNLHKILSIHCEMMNFKGNELITSVKLINYELIISSDDISTFQDKNTWKMARSHATIPFK